MSIAPASGLELSAVVLRLRISPARLFDVAGATARAVILALIAQADPMLAATLREHGPAQPYTVALLAEERSAEELAIRITAVGSAIPCALAAAVDHQRLGQPLVIGKARATCAELTTDPLRTPWVRKESLCALMRQADALGDTITCLLASPLLPQVRPACWHVGPGPGPELSPTALFEAMWGRWPALGPVVPRLSLERVRSAAAQAEVLATQIAVTTVLQRGGAYPQRAEQCGFTGRITLRLGGSVEERALLRMLAATSFYLGAGVGTSSGMGRVRTLHMRSTEASRRTHSRRSSQLPEPPQTRSDAPRRQARQAAGRRCPASARPARPGQFAQSGQ